MSLWKLGEPQKCDGVFMRQILFKMHHVTVAGILRFCQKMLDVFSLNTVRTPLQLALDFKLWILKLRKVSCSPNRSAV